MVPSDALSADVVLAEALPLRDLWLTAVMVVNSTSSQDDLHGSGHLTVTSSGRPASLAVEKGPHRIGPVHWIPLSKNTPPAAAGPHSSVDPWTHRGSRDRPLRRSERRPCLGHPTPSSEPTLSHPF